MGENLNSWIKKELQSRGWSIRELGRRSGISQSTISRVLSGETNPSLDFYQGIAKAFDVTIGQIELLESQGIEPGDSEALDSNLTLREAYDIMSRLSPSQQKEMLRYAWYLLRSGQVGDDEGEDSDR